MTRSRHYDLSERIEIVFETGEPDWHVWIVERPDRVGAGGQVHLTPDEWDDLVRHARTIRARAQPR